MIRKFLRCYLVFFLSLITWNVFSQDFTVVEESPETLTIDINVYGVKDKECVKAALPYAYYTTFFRGFPTTYYYKEPLVGTNESFADKHRDYFSKMESGRFSSFITNMYLINYNKKAKPKIGTVRMVINMMALKRDLESQGIKRNFGLW